MSMYSSIVILCICFALAAIFLWIMKVEKYTAPSSYIMYKTTNFPGGDFPGGPAWVKDDTECRAACDATSLCSGFAISTGTDTSRPSNQQRQCYFKFSTAFDKNNKTPSNDWNTFMKTGKKETPSKGRASFIKKIEEQTKNCTSSSKVVLYSDGAQSQNAKRYGCGVFDVTKDFAPNSGAGVSGFSVPDDLVMYFYGIPTGGPNGIDGRKYPMISKKVTGSGDLGNLPPGTLSFNWNDRVEKIFVLQRKK